MEIQNLQARVFYLAGALDEAKKLYESALKEIEAQQPKKEDSEEKK